jgi:predicted enzyme related to lactoylglutathione lyase
MEVREATVGLPVRDLSRAVAWYRRVLELDEPDLEPAAGVVEFRLGPIWLQLGEDATARSGAEAVTRFGVRDAAAERDRIEGLGVAVGPLEHVPGAVDYFDFTDPDGNVLSLYSEVGS